MVQALTRVGLGSQGYELDRPGDGAGSRGEKARVLWPQEDAGRRRLQDKKVSDWAANTLEGEEVA